MPVTIVSMKEILLCDHLNKNLFDMVMFVLYGILQDKF